MLVKGRGIVLRQIPYNDNSIIVKIFSEHNGVVSAIIKRSTSGKSKNKKSGLLLPLTLLNFEYELKPNDHFVVIKEMRLHQETAITIGYEIYKSNIKIFLGEVLGACLREHQGDASLFNFTFQSIVYLNFNQTNPKNFHLVFLSQLCKHFGILPDEKYTPPKPYFNIETGLLQNTQPLYYPVSAETSKMLFVFFETETLENADKIVIDNTLRRELLRLLVKYLDHYLHTLKNIKSLDVLEEVFG